MAPHAIGVCARAAQETEPDSAPQSTNRSDEKPRDNKRCGGRGGFRTREACGPRPGCPHLTSGQTPGRARRRPLPTGDCDQRKRGGPKADRQRRKPKRGGPKADRQRRKPKRGGPKADRQRQKTRHPPNTSPRAPMSGRVCPDRVRRWGDLKCLRLVQTSYVGDLKCLHPVDRNVDGRRPTDDAPKKPRKTNESGTDKPKQAEPPMPLSLALSVTTGSRVLAEGRLHRSRREPHVTAVAVPGSALGRSAR